MQEANEVTLAEARKLKAEFVSRMFGAEAMAAGDKVGLAAAMPTTGNVVGVGYGAKVTSGTGLDDVAIRVYVRTKLPVGELTAVERVPAQVNGVPTDVLQVGDIISSARPSSAGVSVGHYSITAGTAGCVVERHPATDRFILSNNHVLANSNDGQLGDPILEPGPIDGGDPANPIGTLHDYEPIMFDGPSNSYDAAIARLIIQTDMTPDIPQVGRVARPPVTAALYQSVRKFGRTTRHTVGVIVDLSADIRVQFGTKVAAFDNQLAVLGAGGDFSAGGDSGSLIVEAVSLRPVALLFAGGTGTTFGSPIQPILDRFDVSIL